MLKTVCLVLLLLAGIIKSEAQIGAKGLAINTQAPGFSGKDQNGKKIKSAKLLKEGKIVLLFYRGQWCPYCNKQLKALEDSINLITAKGATLIAVTPEKPENIEKTITKTKAGFSILYDKGLQIMNAYGVSFKVDDATMEKYKGYGIDFEKANGSNGANLPVPAVYIINREGVITYRFFDNDYKKRPTVVQLLEQL